MLASAGPSCAQAPGSTIELPDIGLGIQRTSGTYIALLLQLENDREQQAAIIADVCEHLGLSLEKIIEYRDWLAAGGTINGDAPTV